MGYISINSKVKTISSSLNANLNMIQKNPKILYEFIFQIIEFQLCFWFIPRLLSSIKTFKRGKNEKNENWGHLFHF
jgi:hypothetical protein